jgi:hypothetical protein
MQDCYRQGHHGGWLLVVLAVLPVMLPPGKRCVCHFHLYGNVPGAIA